MKKYLKIISVILCAAAVMSLFSACAKKEQVTPVDKNDFRTTAYIVADRCTDAQQLDTSNFSRVTDFILFGAVTFDESGNLTVNELFEPAYNNIRAAMQEDQHLYINLLGPASQSDSEDWYDQMADLAQRHTNAFESGVLEQNIKELLDKYGFDGVYFDYEYPIKKKYWKPYNSFIVSLDETLGDEYKIGMALADWDAKQTKEAMQATDFVEIMSYDIWDESGNHATVEMAEECVEKFIKKGYERSKLGFGLPFYARPTTHDAYWYDFRSYADAIDENGLFTDSGETGLTFSFNTPAVIKEKTEWAIENGLGGMMVWHYSCDAPASSDKSLFGAIEQAKEEAYK